MGEQVWHAVNKWRNILPAKEQAAKEAAEAARRGRGAANGSAANGDAGTSAAHATAASNASGAGRAVAAPADNDDEEDIAFVEDVGLDEMLEVSSLFIRVCLVCHVVQHEALRLC